jgi:uncharacterized Zn-finger protein
VSVNLAFDGVDAAGAAFKTASQVREDDAGPPPFPALTHALGAGTPCQMPKPPSTNRQHPRIYIKPKTQQVRKLNSYSLVALFARGRDLFFDFVRFLFAAGRFGHACGGRGQKWHKEQPEDTT